ncbi:hypothetical protein F5878DRAFT_667984 [Lentinula raphanica]|uniref:Uncharacterized protein n=1 Tax=Lentinula raphanica TaxID=153919 RepID=A0AA38NV05_9AGAR|nr:hypothetical protein F5878DRAFT_667984 [Lentinula raphanica]
MSNLEDNMSVAVAIPTQKSKPHKANVLIGRRGNTNNSSRMSNLEDNMQAIKEGFLDIAQDMLKHAWTCWGSYHYVSDMLGHARTCSGSHHHVLDMLEHAQTCWGSYHYFSDMLKHAWMYSDSHHYVSDMVVAV